MNKLLSVFRPAHVLALIPIAATLIRLTQSQTLYTNLLPIIALLVLYIVVVVLAGRLQEGFWTGYIALATYVAWLIGGLTLALAIVIVGTLIALPIYWLYVEKSKLSTEIPAEIAGRIAILGNGMLITHGIFQTLGGTLPFTDANLHQMLPLTVAFACGYLIMQIIGVAITDISVVQRFKGAGSGLLLEPLLITVIFVLPLINASVGSIAFVVMVGLTGAQAVRRHQVDAANDALMRRLKEMSLLNTLSKTIASHIELDDVLDAIHREIRNLVNATTFFVALYNSDRKTIEYPLAFQNNQLQAWATRQPGNTLTDAIIRTRKTIRVDTHNKAQLEALNIDPATLSERVYIGIPLMVGEKFLGALVVAHTTDPETFNEGDIELLQTVATQASLALRNATLYRRTVNLAQDLSLINQSLQDVMFNLDRSEAMRTACQIAIQVTDAQKAAFFLLQPNRDNRLELAQALGFDEPILFDSLPYQPHLFREGPRIITNIDDCDDPVLQQHALDAGFKAIVQIPLRSGITMVGCLCVYHQNVHFHETPEINLLIMLANQITAALDNGDLLQALELYAAEQAQLVHLSRISTVNLDLETIVIDICDMLADMMVTSRAEIGLYEPETEKLHLYSPIANNLNKTGITLAAIPEFEDVLLEKTGTASQVYYNDLPKYSEALGTYMAQRGDTTLAVLPLRTNQQNVGLILLGDETHRLFNDNDNRLLEMATHQIAVHIHNARIHSLTEDTLLKRLDELSLLEESAQQVSQELNINRLISSVLAAAMRATQAEFAAIALENANTPEWYDVIIKEQRDNGVSHRTSSMMLNTGIVAQVSHTREAVVIANNQAAPDYYPPPDTVVPYQSSLAVPLIKGERVIGVLDIESTRLNFFTAEHVNFIKSLAGHAAVSLENANLVKKLNTSNERMRAILNSTRDGIILLDDDGRILDANSAAQNMLKLPLRDNLESKLADVVHAQPIDHPLFHDLTNGYISNPQSIHESEYVLPADENQHIATIKAFVIPVNEGEANSGHMLLLRDVSEEKELQKFRETSQSMVIHDLLNPLTSIISNLYWTIQLVQHPGTKPIQETLLPSLSSSVKSAQQLMGLVETLRDIPMIRQMELQPKPILLELIAMNAHELLTGFMRDANITVDYDIPAGLKVHVDSDLVQRVFVNLLHNAAKFTPVDGRILIIADTQTDQADYIRVRVCDSGVGIPPEHRQRIFGQFEQIESQRPRAGGKGTGLGLNFCKLVVEAHGGTIWVEEENPLSGACFAFTLPTSEMKF